MTDQQRETDDTDAGVTEQEYGNLTVEDDPQGTTDPADLADTAGPDDDGGRQNPERSSLDRSPRCSGVGDCGVCRVKRQARPAKVGTQPP